MELCKGEMEGWELEQLWSLRPLFRGRAVNRRPL